MNPMVARLVERFRQAEEQTVAFFHNLPSEAWERVLYTDGATWRVRDVLAHIVAAEDAMRRLVEGIVRGETEGVPPDFDLDAYNQRKVRQWAGVPVEDLLQRFTHYREQTIALIASLSEADLQKEGRHPFLGWAKVVDILQLMTTHVRLHLRDIRRALPPEAA